MRYEKPANRTSRSSLFLIELIIAIFFLALTSAVCVRLYLQAHRLSVRSSDLTHAVQEAQNVAECFIAADGDLTAALSLYEGEDAAAVRDMNSVTTVPSACTIDYDSSWDRIRVALSELSSAQETVSAAEDASAYSMVLRVTEKSRSEQGSLLNMHISINSLTGSDASVHSEDSSLKEIGTMIYETDVEQYAGNS